MRSYKALTLTRRRRGRKGKAKWNKRSACRSWGGEATELGGAAGLKRKTANLPRRRNEGGREKWELRVT